MTTYRLASWVGVTDEEQAPYNTVVSDATATLDASLAYAKDSYHLENAFWVPMSEKDQIKQLIMQYGACATAYYDDYSYYNNPFTTETEEPIAYYCPDGNQTVNMRLQLLGGMTIIVRRILVQISHQQMVPGCVRIAGALLSVKMACFIFLMKMQL